MRGKLGSIQGCILLSKTANWDSYLCVYTHVQNTLVGDRAVSPAYPPTVRIIGIADGIGAIAGGGQSATLCPCERPPCSVIVAGGVTHGIVGDALAVNRGQQVFPSRIPVGVDMPIAKSVIVVKSGSFQGFIFSPKLP